VKKRRMIMKTVKIYDQEFKVKYGFEGSEQDPYAYTEISYTEKQIIIHLGLNFFIKKGRKLVRNLNEEQAEEIFKNETGVSIEDVLYKSLERPICPVCENSDTEAAYGMPGETLFICLNCNLIVGCEVNEYETK
jgi:hypothetical protein